ncbi:N-6 DNA methylase [Olleya namhaensis]|uniref:N-6 DNA methylase n=1 Tax=Olleya namhaensis TaxID=1144750 RepID=UPI00248F52D6|nr:N-6 DNA methylase [Olleya namhaensis]
MQVTITENEEKNAIELLFSENLPKEFSTFLLELGFREVLKKKNTWYADAHPAYKSFAASLRDAFSRGDDWKTVSMYPSFHPSLENIDKSKFSFVTISYRGTEKAETKDYVLFDPYKKVATEIATQYAITKYGDDLQNIEVSPRNYKRKARILYDKGQIINRIEVEDKSEIEELPAKEIENELPKENNKTENEETLEEVPKENESGYKTDKERKISTREILNEVIGKLTILGNRLEDEDETIIATTVLDLEDAAEQSSDLCFKNELIKALQNFKDWIFDLTFSSRTMALMEINRLNQSLDLPLFHLKEEVAKTLSVSKDIFNRDHIVPNVLVPTKAGEPFQSGGLNLNEANFMRMKFKRLYNITDDTIEQASGLDLFRLSQMAHPNDYGINVNRSTVLREWESRGREAFEEIGYPTDLDYPYVNVHTGYKSVSTLASQIGAYDDRHQWWSAVEHSRPIADLAKGIAIMDSLLIELVERKLELVNPKTNKPRTDKKSKEAFNDIEWEISRLERSKLVIQDYMNKDLEVEESLPEPKPKKEKHQEPNDYLDKVIALMHTAFAKAERLSKKKIEKLRAETNAPTMGALWEAVELSWLLWYKMLYREPIPFEARLKKMVLFWNKVQPTYAYSDSSKELYKQYSTPCPIGAIIAQYTQMEDAEFIFEPSAGNGLLLVGANPRITHVNEIDKSRKQSLEHQGFGRITSDNAAQPFPEMMHKVHDVVVTNPPFASWDDSKFDKERIIQKYFNKHRGLANHIRLEHLMAGLALYTMKDDGKAAIIIMGHVYFGDDGLFAKYRPFFNWLYRHYKVDDVINMNSYKLYNKQGAVTKTMLILIDGRKSKPSGVAPNKSEQPHLEDIVETFEDLWKQTKSHIKPNIETIIKQLKTARTQ